MDFQLAKVQVAVFSFWLVTPKAIIAMLPLSWKTDCSVGGYESGEASEIPALMAAVCGFLALGEFNPKLPYSCCKVN